MRYLSVNCRVYEQNRSAFGVEKICSSSITIILVPLILEQMWQLLRDV